jgi:hypothetical protein
VNVEILQEAEDERENMNTVTAKGAEATHQRAPVAKTVAREKRPRRRYDWSATWAKIDAIYGGKSAPGKPGSQIIIEGRR